METIIDKAKAELGAAIGQSIAADDQIIMDHVKKAWAYLDAIGPHHHVAGTTIGQHIDKCALCGLDLCDDIHLRVPDNSCQYPDCGCEEARLCMAGEANNAAMAINLPKRRTPS